ncbi:DUF3618 domain-containing protein [Actinoallomurus sp. CA-142502]|uniref:DUF3618 domain-containing protein n=1 Tax=Actinoallomurus sp. CA-142502 TaxID=3239885 RepID=UPI003D94E06D
MGTTPDEMRNEIEHTRAGPGADVDRIVDRAGPRQAERARAAVRGVRERLMGLPDTRPQESGAGDGITGPARDAAETVRERGPGGPGRAATLSPRVWSRSAWGSWRRRCRRPHRPRERRAAAYTSVPMR